MKKSEVVFILVGVGWYVALSLLLPFGIGFWLDKKKFNSFPLLSLVGLGLGTIIMVFGVYRMIQKVQNTDTSQMETRKNTGTQNTEKKNPNEKNSSSLPTGKAGTNKRE